MPIAANEPIACLHAETILSSLALNRKSVISIALGLIVGTPLAIASRPIWDRPATPYRMLDREIFDRSRAFSLTILPATNGVEIVEFMDYECPPCRAISPQALLAIQNFGRGTGYRIAPYPLSIHPSAKPLAIAALAAQKLGFGRAFHDWCLVGNLPSMAKVEAFALSHGVAQENWRTATNTPEIVQMVDQAASLGPALGLPGTPSFCVVTQKHNALVFTGFDQALSYAIEHRRPPLFPWDP